MGDSQVSWTRTFVKPSLWSQAPTKNLLGFFLADRSSIHQQTPGKPHHGNIICQSFIFTIMNSQPSLTSKSYMNHQLPPWKTWFTGRRTWQSTWHWTPESTIKGIPWIIGLSSIKYYHEYMTNKSQLYHIYTGVSINGGIQKWMVRMKNPTKIDPWQSLGLLICSHLLM